MVSENPERGEYGHYMHEIIIEICDDQPTQSQTCTIYHPHHPPIVRPPVGSLGKLVGEYKKRFHDLAQKGSGIHGPFPSTPATLCSNWTTDGP